MTNALGAWAYCFFFDNLLGCISNGHHATGRRGAFFALLLFYEYGKWFNEF